MSWRSMALMRYSVVLPFCYQRMKGMRSRLLCGRKSLKSRRVMVSEEVCESMRRVQVAPLTCTYENLQAERADIHMECGLMRG